MKTIFKGEKAQYFYVAQISRSFEMETTLVGVMWVTSMLPISKANYAI